MPTYDYQCAKCDVTEEHTHPMSESPEVKCPKCGERMTVKISSNFGGFIMKGGTPAIHYREKQNRLKRSEEMARRQKLAYGDGGNRAKPNIAGVETGTWDRAHRIAKEITKETGINSDSFKPFAEKEKVKKKIIV